MDFAARCKKANARKGYGGLTMAEWAVEAGVSRGFLYRVLDGQQSPTIEVAARIAEAVGLELKLAGPGSRRR